MIQRVPTHISFDNAAVYFLYAPEGLLSGDRPQHVRAPSYRMVAVRMGGTYRAPLAGTALHGPGTFAADSVVAL
jgi:hypothetical protein